MNKFNFIPSTAKGFIALLLWSTSASVISTMTTLPEYELLCISFALAGGFTLARLILKNEWETLKGCWKSWSLVLSGVLLQQILYIFAFHSANAAEVDLIIYLWPSLCVILSTIYFREKLRVFHIVSVLFGTLAIICLTFNESSFNEFNFGHICAFSCAISWAVYSVFSRNLDPIHPNKFGVAYGIGLCVVLPLHLTHDTFIMPTFGDMGLMVYFAICCTLGAFTLWTSGMQNGRSKYLMLTAYIKPVCSLSLLCLLGFAEPTIELILATACIFIAGLTTNLGAFPHISEYFKDISIRSIQALDPRTN